MSLYCEVKTEFKNESALISALMETGGWNESQIEIHAEPQSLIGYHGDIRPERANIIIRRRFIGSASNDIGMIKEENGQYRAIISEYDGRKYNQAWIDKLKGNYAYQVIKQDQERRGRIVSREKLENGKQRLTVRGYR